MNVIKTKFVGRHPFKSEGVDVTTLRVTNDKPIGRRPKTHKYDDVFSQLSPGKSIACKSDDADRLSQAVRSFVIRNKKDWKVSMCKYYTKTTGRVFILE